VGVHEGEALLRTPVIVDLEDELVVVESAVSGRDVVVHERAGNIGVRQIMLFFL